MSGGVSSNKRKDLPVGGLPNKKPRIQSNGQASPATFKTPKTPGKAAASAFANGNTPTTGDGDQKRKRGRPSKADLAARAAAQGDASTPAKDSIAGGAAPIANMMGASGTTPSGKRRGRPTKAEVLMRQVWMRRLQV